VPNPVVRSLYMRAPLRTFRSVCRRNRQPPVRTRRSTTRDFRAIERCRDGSSRHLGTTLGSPGALCALLWLAGGLGCGDSSSAGRDGGVVDEPAYGAGHFGTWVVDDHGLPAYDFKPPTTGPTTWPTTGIDPPGAFHQLGNDAITALAHPGGQIELFTARTFPRFANRLDDALGHWAGGFGWVVGPGFQFSTLGADAPDGAVELRRFGMGYVRRDIAHAGVRISQVVFAPDGDDEVLIETLSFTNTTGAAMALSYVDYWGVAGMFPRFGSHNYEADTVTTRHDPARQAVVVESTRVPGDLTVPSATVDPSPKAWFVTALDHAIDGFDTVGSAFVGGGTRALPAAVAAGALTGSLDPSGTLHESDAVLVTQERLALAPGESVTLHLLYGLAPTGRQDEVIDRYRADYQQRFADMTTRWSTTAPVVSFPALPWIGRELAWDYYYLVSGSLLEDYFGAHVVNQGSAYLYGWGQNVALRDPLQHVMPLIYAEPRLARETIRYVLAATSSDGRTPYGTSGYGAASTLNSFFNPSDIGLWLIWAATEYVGATRDFAFLDAPVRTYDGVSTTVFELLSRVFAFQTQTVGIGRHGLVHMLNADWNDLFVQLAPDPAGTIADGESTMNTALALIVYPQLRALAQRRADDALASAITAQTDALTAAMQAQWRGRWFDRGYLNAGATLEVGADNLCIESNGPALLVPGLLTDDQTTALVQAIDTELSAPSRLGMPLEGAPIPAAFASAGVNATGIWYSIVGLTINGLARVGAQHPAAAQLAWKEFAKATLANHATQYPDIWYGIWSGPDAYHGDAEPALAGQTWDFDLADGMVDWPVTNMHAHSQPLLSSLRLAGVSASADGITIDPVAPYDNLSWTSHSFAVTYTPASVAGSIQTLGADTFTMTVKLPPGVATAASVVVDGVAVEPTVSPPFVTFPVTSTAGSVVTWSISAR